MKGRNGTRQRFAATARQTVLSFVAAFVLGAPSASAAQSGPTPAPCGFAAADSAWLGNALAG